MSLLPDGASLEEWVQDCFLAYRGCGVTLSALDAEILSQWAHSGAPFKVIARGIRRAAEKAAWHTAPGEPVLRSLRACRRDVESEIRRHGWQSAGGTEQRRSSRGLRLPADRRAQAQAELQRLAEERPELAEEIDLLKSAITGPPVETASLPERFDILEVRLLRALPFPERLEVLREVRSRTGELSRRASSRARTLARRFQRSAALRKKLGLPSFW
jgi:chromosome segregation ATPase